MKYENPYIAEEPQQEDESDIYQQVLKGMWNACKLSFTQDTPHFFTAGKFWQKPLDSEVIRYMIDQQTKEGVNISAGDEPDRRRTTNILHDVNGQNEMFELYGFISFDEQYEAEQSEESKDNIRTLDAKTWYQKTKISGAYLQHEIAVSRSAWWKQIKSDSGLEAVRKENRNTEKKFFDRLRDQPNRDAEQLQYNVSVITRFLCGILTATLTQRETHTGA